MASVIETVDKLVETHRAMRELVGEEEFARRVKPYKRFVAAAEKQLGVGTLQAAVHAAVDARGQGHMEAAMMLLLAAYEMVAETEEAPDE